MLHNELRGQVTAQVALGRAKPPAAQAPPPVLPALGTNSKFRPWLVIGSLLTAAIYLVIMWKGAPPRQAGAVELSRVIAASARRLDHAYRIEVESNIAGGAKPKRTLDEALRPPKPPLDGASLFVGGSDRFVLQRQTPEGLPFITGCDGKQSWMVPPDGPVRVSSDLQEFNRDVPGHEVSMSLANLNKALNP